MFNRNRTFICETTSKRDGTGRLMRLFGKINRPGLLIETFWKKINKPGLLIETFQQQQKRPGRLIETFQKK